MISKRGQGIPFGSMVWIILAIVGFLIIFALYLYFNAETTAAATEIIFGALGK